MTTGLVIALGVWLLGIVFFGGLLAIARRADERAAEAWLEAQL